MKRRLLLVLLFGLCIVFLSQWIVLGSEDYLWKEAPEAPPGVPMVDTSQYKIEPPWTIGYCNPSLSNTWRIFGLANMYWASSKYPDIKEIIHFNANDSVSKQISDMEDLITKGVDLIVLAATSGKALVPKVDQAIAAGIPVVILERGISSENYTTFIDTGAKEIATAQARGVAEALGEKGNVVLFGIIPGLTISDEQEESYRKVLAEYPDVNILDFQYSLVSRAKGKEIMENYLTAYDRIDGVIAWDGDTVQGAVEAAKEAGRYEEIKAWSGDECMGMLKLMKEGLNGIAVPSPNYCTVDALQAARMILSGKKVPKLWKVPLTVITKENVDKYYIEGSEPTWYMSIMPNDEIDKWLKKASQ